MPSISDERLAELTDRLENGIRDLYASGRYAEYLAATSKFHRYSFGNALLILLQCPTASTVAGYNTWKKRLGGRSSGVKKAYRFWPPVNSPIWWSTRKLTQPPDNPSMARMANP